MFSQLKNRTMATTTHTTTIKEDLIIEFSKTGKELFTINSKQGLKDLCKHFGLRDTFNFEYGSGVSCHETDPCSWSGTKAGIKLSENSSYSMNRNGHSTWTQFQYGKQFTSKVVQERLNKMHNIHVNSIRKENLNDYRNELNTYLSQWSRGSLSTENVNIKMLADTTLILNNDTYFQRTLNDWSRFDINNRTTHDASISSGLALMACNKNKYRPIPKIVRQSYNLGIKKYDNRGSLSKIIK